MWIPQTLYIKGIFDTQLAPVLPGVIEQVPLITLDKGTLSSNATQPYTITYPDSGKPLAIIDTTGSITSLNTEDAQLLLKETEMVIKHPSGQIEKRSYEGMDNFELTSDKLTGWYTVFKKWNPLIIYVAGVLGSFLMKIVELLLYGLSGLLVANIFKVKLPLMITTRLAAVALTPALLVSALLVTVFKVSALDPTLEFIAVLAYMLFAIRTCGDFAKEDSTGAEK